MSRSRSERSAAGLCPVHGRVVAAKESLQPSFPIVVYLVRRVAQRLSPFRCPECRARLAKVADGADPAREVDEHELVATAPRILSDRRPASDGQSAVRVRGLVKSYSGVPAVRSID